MLAKLCLLFAFTFPGDSIPPPPPPPACPPAEEMFLTWERMPLFPGCEGYDCSGKAIVDFLQHHLRYPKVGACIEGMVIVSMIIAEDGSIGEVRVRRGINRYADKEALRAVLQMKHEHPKWVPGYFGDRPMKTTYYLPVRFKLE